MDSLINILIYVIVFIIAAYGLNWTCIKFNFPEPVRWICGVVLIVLILVFLNRLI